DRRYTVEEIADHRYRSWFGDKFDLAWFKKNSLLTWPRKAEEIYWDPHVKARIPVYYEHFLAMRDGVEAVKAETGLFADLDSSDYQPIPDWKPCPSYTESREEYDLYAVYFRVPFHSFTLTGNDAWVDEVSTIDPYTNGININSATARRKDVKEGDWIELQSAANGETVRGRAHLTEAIHPEVVAVSGHGGHWAKALPLASMPGKGVAFDRLLPIDFDHVDTPSFNLDLCAKVKVSKVAGP
ncbi:MAG: molybdopterin-binding protein, partial [Actinomycetia bacterium]|nr:molybdopterin-binding protein [Actinomycetes bacterium]